MPCRITFGSIEAARGCARGTIGGGQQNTILANSDHSTIPGGDSLIANGYAQTVVGFHNATSTAVSRSTARAGGVINNPLLIVGNGTSANGPSNAFEISYDGHSTVFDNNGNSSSGGMRPAIYGGTYQDNTIAAWGDIAAGAAPYPSAATVNADFGVTNVNHTAKGVYVVNLLIKDEFNNVVTLNHGSVTVTVEDNSPTSANCGFATASSVSGNSFTVHIHDTSCNPEDMPFMFKVCGRP